MIAWILDAVPWWSWYLLAFIVAAITAPYWMPVARIVWFLLPNWARVALAGLALAVGAYLAGRNRGRQNELDRQKERDAAAVKNRLETNQKVDRMTPAKRKKELDKWMRD